MLWPTPPVPVGQCTSPRILTDLPKMWCIEVEKSEEWGALEHVSWLRVYCFSIDTNGYWLWALISTRSSTDISNPHTTQVGHHFPIVQMDPEAQRFIWFYLKLSQLVVDIVLLPPCSEMFTTYPKIAAPYLRKKKNSSSAISSWKQ